MGGWSNQLKTHFFNGKQEAERTESVIRLNSQSLSPTTKVLPPARPRLTKVPQLSQTRPTTRDPELKFMTLWKTFFIQTTTGGRLGRKLIQWRACLANMNTHIKTQAEQHSLLIMGRQSRADPYSGVCWPATLDPLPGSRQVRNPVLKQQTPEERQ